MIRFSLLVALATTLIAISPANAQRPTVDRGAERESWHSESPQPQVVTPTQIIQAKAQMRAQQRMARMASLQWYGFSASRPTASSTPFTGMYTPMWQMPGGRPFAWTPYARTTVVVTR